MSRPTEYLWTAPAHRPERLIAREAGERFGNGSDHMQVQFLRGVLDAVETFSMNWPMQCRAIADQIHSEWPLSERCAIEEVVRTLYEHLSAEKEPAP